MAYVARGSLPECALRHIFAAMHVGHETLPPTTCFNFFMDESLLSLP